MTLRVGSLVFATEQGIGILAKSFYGHGIINEVMVVRHSKHPNHFDWYPRARQITDLRSSGQQAEIREFVRGLDVFLAVETPFDWSLFPFAKEHGVRTALIPMYECCPERMLPLIRQSVDVVLCPSLLDLQYFPGGVFLPVPVGIPWRQRERAEVFVHNGGHLGLRGRNGTRELIDALEFIESPAQIIIRTQESLPRDVEEKCARLSSRVDVSLSKGTFPHEKLLDGADVCLRPEKFNGLSLPLQEARAAGLLCMTTDRFPMNTWLPREPLIPVANYQRAKVGPPYLAFDEAVIDPRQIAAKIDEWYGRDIRAESLAGKAWAEGMSWEKLGPLWREALAP
jgi:hypothetical protein